MEIIVSGRHYQVTSEFKEYCEQLVSAAFSDINLKISNVRLVLSVEKERANANIVVGLKSHDIEASAEDHEMGKAIALAMDKASRQVLKHADKIQDNHKKRVPVKEAECGKVALEEAEAE